jgi:hypothetical protein
LNLFDGIFSPRKPRDNKPNDSAEETSTSTTGCKQRQVHIIPSEFIAIGHKNVGSGQNKSDCWIDNVSARLAIHLPLSASRKKPLYLCFARRSWSLAHRNISIPYSVESCATIFRRSP